VTCIAGMPSQLTGLVVTRWAAKTFPPAEVIVKSCPGESFVSQAYTTCKTLATSLFFSEIDNLFCFLLQFPES